jgi:hypothetical protein
MAAVLEIKAMEEFADVHAQATIADFIDANEPSVPKAKVVKKVKPESSPRATVQAEDAPF